MHTWSLANSLTSSRSLCPASWEAALSSSSRASAVDSSAIWYQKKDKQ